MSLPSEILSDIPIPPLEIPKNKRKSLLAKLRPRKGGRFISLKKIMKKKAKGIKKFVKMIKKE